MAKGFDAVILRGNCFANKQNLDIYKKLGVQYVLTRTVGKDHIDIPYAKELGFKMAFVPGYSPNAIAELAVTHAMMLLRHLAYTTSEAHKGNFVVDKHMFSKEIRNCTVGVIGLGRIGRVCAQIFHGMGAKVVGQDVFQIKGIDDYATQVEMDELLKVSDVISLHCPYIKENGKVVTREFISKMKDGAILVNAARGQLVDTEAVIEAIESGKLGGLLLIRWTAKPICSVRTLKAVRPRMLYSKNSSTCTRKSCFPRIWVPSLTKLSRTWLKRPMKT